jgi:hypothetical protein
MSIELVVALVGAVLGPVIAYILATRKLRADIGAAKEALATQITLSESQRVAEAEISQNQLAAAAKIAQEELLAQNRLSISSYEVIRKLLSQADWELRTFEALKVHLRGFEDNELRKLLIAAGALAFERADGVELWGLLERNEEKLRVSATKRRGPVVDGATPGLAQIAAAPALAPGFPALAKVMPQQGPEPAGLPAAPARVAPVAKPPKR